MGFRSIAESAIWDLVNDAINRMTPAQRRFWEVIRITPEKWQEETHGAARGGFWAVAVIGHSVIWYNDNEYGFNRSHYTRHGVIEGYWSNQNDLEQTVQEILNVIETGIEIWS
jgi:hypothetical protein